MYVTVAQYKGGVAKTTSAIHVAALLSRDGPTLLADADPNRSATNWHERAAKRAKDGLGRPMPFDVIDIQASTMAATQYRHVVIDTPANPQTSDIQSLARGCNFLILPVIPEMMSVQALTQVARDLKALQEINTLDAKPGHAIGKYAALLTMVRTGNPDTQLVLDGLHAINMPVFNSQIRMAVSFTRASQSAVLVGDVRNDPAALKAAEDYENVVQEMLDMLRGPS